MTKKLDVWLATTDGSFTTERLARKAEELGKPVSREYLRQLCEAGTIRASKPGRDWIIPELSANAWLVTWLRG